MTTGKWTLTHGFHRGTLTSRNTGQAQEFDTREEAIKAYEDHRKFYKSIGYKIWFANLESPDGVKQCLESNPYY